MEISSKRGFSKKSRGRPEGPDEKKVYLVLKALAENPEGLWLRRIARKAGLHPTTVSAYMDTILRSLVEDVSLGSEHKPIIRVIKLKASVIKKIEEGASLRQLLQLSGVLKTVGERQKSE